MPNQLKFTEAYFKESLDISATITLLCDGRLMHISDELALIINSVTLGHQNGVPADVVTLALRAPRGLDSVNITLRANGGMHVYEFDVHESITNLVRNMFTVFDSIDEIKSIIRPLRPFETVRFAIDKRVELAKALGAIALKGDVTADDAVKLNAGVFDIAEAGMLLLRHPEIMSVDQESQIKVVSNIAKFVGSRIADMVHNRAPMSVPLIK